MKRLSAVLLCLLFVISFSSCAASGNDTPLQSESTDGSETASDEAATSAPITEESIVSTTYEKPPTYEEIQAEYPDKTVLTWATDRSAHYRTKEINEYLDSLGCDFAVSFTTVYFDYFEEPRIYYSDKIREMIDQGEQIDILHSGYVGYLEGVPYNAYNNLALYGFYEPLDEYFETELGGELYELMPENHWEALRVKGSIYGVDGKMTSMTVEHGYYINAELADKYGFDVTRPIAEQLDVLQQVKDNEPCNVFVLDNLQLEDPAFYLTGDKRITAAVYWDSESHTAKCVLDSPALLEKLRFFDDLSKKRLVSSVLGTSFFMAHVQTEGGSAMYDPETTIDFEFPSSGDFNAPLQAVKVYPVFDEPFTVRNSYSATGICSASQNKEKAFELLALTQTDPYLNNLMTYGIEGVDYDLTEDGQSDTLKGVDWLEYYANFMICLKFTDYRRYVPNLTAEEYKVMYENAVVAEDLDFAFDGRELKQEINTTNIIMEGFRLPAYDQTLEEALAAFREKLEGAGLQKIIDECNRQYEEWKSEN